MKRVRVYKEIISDENLRLAIQEVNAGHRRNGNHSLNKKVIEIEKEYLAEDWTIDEDCKIR